MDMSKVSECDVTECAYNRDKMCHAMAITIGDGERPMCDTFCSASTKGGDMSCMAGVGACKVLMCQYNQNLECNASEIHVGYNGQEIDCLTFQRR